MSGRHQVARAERLLERDLALAAVSLADLAGALVSGDAPLLDHGQAGRL